MAAPSYLFKEYITSDSECDNIIIANNSTKYLGLNIDEHLNFKYHTKIVCCKISRLLSIYWKNTILNIATKKIYHSLAESHINYGITVWCSELAKNLMLNQDMNHIPCTLKPIKTAQNKILRAIFGNAKYEKKSKLYTASSPLYKELRVLKFHDLYYYNLALLAFEYFNDELPEKIEDLYISKTQNSRNRVPNLTYDVPRLKKTYKKPSIASSIMWNKLPYKIKEIKNKSTFKENLKNYFINQY